MRHLKVLSQGWCLSCPGVSPRSRNPLKYEQALPQNTKAREHFSLKANELNLEKENFSFAAKEKQLRFDQH